MERKVIAKKKRILAHISYKQYRELLAFVEEFYLADYTLKILVARKGSNLFCALLDLVQEEDGGRVRRLYEKKFPTKEEKPIIISDRALDYYVQDIKAGKYPTVLIADDTIRHGTTIFGLYDKVCELLSGVGEHGQVDVRAFAASKDDMIKRPWIKDGDIKNYVGLDEYRGISDMVIDILYLAGQPYTSYVPNIILQKQVPLYQLIKKALEDLPKCSLDDVEQKKLKFRSNIWIDPHTPNFAMFQSMRFYLNEDLEQCMIVPMVSLRPISDETLSDYGSILKDFILPDYYDRVFFSCKELSYRAIIYVISSLFLRLYLCEELEYQGAFNKLERPTEESMNFGGEILNQDKVNDMSVQEIKNVMEKLEAGYQSVDLQEVQMSDTNVMESDTEVREQIHAVSLRQMTTDDKVREIFSIIGDWNEKNREKALSQGNTQQRDVCGYPFICLSNQLGEGGENKQEVYYQTLRAIDYGSGSIVDKAKTRNDKTYYLSFLNAGERNYKYKEMKYFPFLYGLCEIEQQAMKKGKNSNECKMAFVQQCGDSYELDENEKKELEALCKTSIKSQYRTVLLKDSWFYPNRDALDKAISLVYKIMQ